MNRIQKLSKRLAPRLAAAPPAAEKPIRGSCPGKAGHPEAWRHMPRLRQRSLR